MCVEICVLASISNEVFRLPHLPTGGTKLRAMKLDKAANVLKEGIEETLAYTYFPREHWTRIRTNNPLERIMREIKRRTRVVGAFPDGNSALMLVTARLRYIAHTKWGLKKYLDTNKLKQEDL